MSSLLLLFYFIFVFLPQSGGFVFDKMANITQWSHFLLRKNGGGTKKEGERELLVVWKREFILRNEPELTGELPWCFEEGTQPVFFSYSAWISSKAIFHNGQCMEISCFSFCVHVHDQMCLCVCVCTCASLDALDSRLTKHVWSMLLFWCQKFNWILIVMACLHIFTLWKLYFLNIKV